MKNVRVGKDRYGRLTLRFIYDPFRIAQVKKIKGYRWNPDKKHWSFPDTEETLQHIQKAFKEEVRVPDPMMDKRVP